jgi:hypothetical protein
MNNQELTTAAYGIWKAEEVAYITELHWTSDDKSSLTMVTLVQPRDQLTKSWPRREGPWYNVTIQFSEVRNFSLVKFALPQQLMGFSVENLKERGLEGINYYVEDYENGIIEFYAKTADLVSVERYHAEVD